MTASNETLYVDPEVAFAGHRVIRDGNAVEAVRAAFNEAIARAMSRNRQPLMVEVTLRVAPNKEPQ
jgi:TPP-dependent pyruvate/acetoin dehydrogenase alpha subunit